MSPITAQVRAPSMLARAAVGVLLLVGLYVLVLGAAIAMAVTPPLLTWGGKGVPVLLYVVLWVPAGLLVWSLFAAELPPPPSEGLRLARDDAPRLFALLDDLARVAGIAPPTEVVLTPDVNLSVRETRGRHRHRVLRIGAPVLLEVTVEELAAGLAHELGHYAFGDTRLTYLVAHIQEKFLHLLVETRKAELRGGGFGMQIGHQLARAIAEAIVVNYAKLFWHLTRPTSRRSELAADELAARIIGPDAIVRLLEKLRVANAVYDAYIGQRVELAVAAGGLPSDLFAGLAHSARRFDERGILADVRKAAWEAKTERFATHPSLRDRADALRELGARLGPSAPLVDLGKADERALSLVAVAVEPWLVEHLRSHVTQQNPWRAALRVAPWSELAATVVPQYLVTHAREIGGKVAAFHPDARDLGQLFARLVGDLERGLLEEMARAFHPAIVRLPRPQFDEAARGIVALVLTHLLGGALIERGARIDPAFGEEGLAYELQGAVTSPRRLAVGAMKGDSEARVALRGWAAWMTTPPTSEGDASAPPAAPPPTA